MDEVEALLERVIGVGPGPRIGYREAFLEHAGFDPFTAPDDAIARHFSSLGVAPGIGTALSRRDHLDLILATRVQSRLGPGLAFVYDFPSDQAALSRIRDGSPPVAERFEAFIGGVEVGKRVSRARRRG